MDDERTPIKGTTLSYEACPPRDVAWRFYPQGKLKKISHLDVIRELFDQGWEGCFYAAILRVPGEWPVEDDGYMDLYEAETACRLLADLCNYKLYDSNGKELN